MDKITSIKIKKEDGTYSNQIPISIIAENVEWDSTHTLVDILGSIDVDVTGTIQYQISRLFNEKVSITQLNNYVASQLNTDVTTWLNNNVNPVGSAVTVDSSLIISGSAADAKATGDKIADLKSELTDETNARILLAGRMTTAEGDIDTLETHKVAQPLDEYNQPTDGADGQSLRTKGDGTTEWADVGLPTDAQTSQAVSDWLDDHPEATTTVQEHSLDYTKLVIGTLGYVTPEMCGVIENGICNIDKFQDMLANYKNIKFASDFEFQFIPSSTVNSPTRIKIENKKGIVIDGCGHTVTMSGLTKAYLESINDISSSGRDIFSFLAFHGCENITVKNINFIGTNAYDAQNFIQICIAEKHWDSF